MTRFSFAFAAALLLTAASVSAATPAKTANTGSTATPSETYCSSHAKECKDSATAFDKWCSANAEKCIAVKAEAEHRIEYCQINAQKCAEHEKAMADKLKAYCNKHADAPRCKAMKDNKGTGKQ